MRMAAASSSPTKRRPACTNDGIAYIREDVSTGTVNEIAKTAPHRNLDPQAPTMTLGLQGCRKSPFAISSKGPISR